MAAMTSSSDGRASDDAVREATGRPWDGWFEWLHDHHADELDHGAIVALLDVEGDLPSTWWRQLVTRGFEQHLGRSVPGEASDGTFAIGARRTFRSSPMRAWSLVASADGAAAWLGAAPNEWWHGELGGPERGDVLEAPGGERYEVRSVVPGTRIRLRTLGPLQPVTTIQLTISGERGRTVVGLHQEGLADEDLREPQREHWKRALDRIATLLDEA
jgi:uncharacterized protein YndB with AHSA1/START domain